jgi:hypothetical protein
METAPNTAAKAGTLKLTSRFPTRARDARYDEQTNVETQIKGFFSSQEWANRPETQFVDIPLQPWALRLSPVYYSADFSV